LTSERTTDGFEFSVMRWGSTYAAIFNTPKHLKLSAPPFASKAQAWSVSESAADLPKPSRLLSIGRTPSIFLAADVSVIPPNQQTRFFWQRRHFSGVCSIPGIPSLNEIRRTSGNIIRMLSAVTDAQEHSCDYECNTPEGNEPLPCVSARGRLVKR